MVKVRFGRRRSGSASSKTSNNSGRSRSRSGSRSRSSSARSRQPTTVKAAPVSYGYTTRTFGMSADSGGRGRGSWKSIKNSELVAANIASHVGFIREREFSLNPGLSLTFPTLSIEARVWTQYRVKSFKARFTSVSPTSSAGEVCLCPIYDPTFGSESTEIQAMAQFGAVAGPIWSEVSVDMDPNLIHVLGPRLYVRTSSNAGDLRTSDFGALYVYTANCAADGVVIGKLYFDYEIEFYVPSLGADNLFPLINATTNTNGVNSVTAGVATTVVWDPTGNGTHDSLIFKFYRDLIQSGQVFNLPPGSWILRVDLQVTPVGLTAGNVMSVNGYWEGANSAGTFIELTSNSNLNGEATAMFTGSHVCPIRAFWNTDSFTLGGPSTFLVRYRVLANGTGMTSASVRAFITIAGA